MDPVPAGGGGEGRGGEGGGDRGEGRGRSKDMVYHRTPMLYLISSGVSANRLSVICCCVTGWKASTEKPQFK